MDLSQRNMPKDRNAAFIVRCRIKSWPGDFEETITYDRGSICRLKQIKASKLHQYQAAYVGISSRHIDALRDADNR